MITTLKHIIRNVHLLEFCGGSGNREESVEEVVDDGGDAEAGEEGHLVDAGCGQRNGSSSFVRIISTLIMSVEMGKKFTGSSESDDVNEDTEDVGSVRAEARSKYAGPSIESEVTYRKLIPQV